MKIMKRVKGRIVAMDFLGERTITIKEYRKHKPRVFSIDETIISNKSFTTVEKGEGDSNEYLEVGDLLDILLFDVVINGVSVEKSLFGGTKPSNEKMRDDGDFYTLDFETDEEHNAPF